MIHFLYLVRQFSGNLVADEREGVLSWHDLKHVSSLTMPPANAAFLPHVLNQDETFYQAKYSYNAEWRLVEVTENSLVADTNLVKRHQED